MEDEKVSFRETQGEKGTQLAMTGLEGSVSEGKKEGRVAFRCWKTQGSQSSSRSLRKKGHPADTLV